MTEPGVCQILKPLSNNLKEDFFNGISSEPTFAVSGTKVSNGPILTL